MTPEDLHAAVADRLTGARQRYTRNRRALVDELRASDTPLTITEILDRRDGLAMSTTYRNLTLLEQCGVVDRLAPLPLEEARFELAEPFLAHHHHLVCTRCGHVADLAVPDHIEADLHALTARAAQLEGFTITGHRLDFLGLCRRCP